MRWRCWVPAEGYSRADAKDIEADDAREAAELFAEKWYEGGDHFRTIDVMAASWGSGSSSAQMFRVTVDFDPSFHASELMIVEGAP